MSHSLASIKAMPETTSLGISIAPASIQVLKEEILTIDKSDVTNDNVSRKSVDYERTGLADSIINMPVEIQKGKYQSPLTRLCIIDDDIKWLEFEYLKKVSFDYYSKLTPFLYNQFYDDIISIVLIVFGKDKHNGLIKKTIVERTIIELLLLKENFIMTQSTLHRLLTDIQDRYEILRKHNTFKQVFSTLHKVLQIAVNNEKSTGGCFSMCTKI